MNEPSQVHSNMEQEILETSKEAVSFAGLRAVSNALWIGSTALGVYAEQKLGVPPLVISPVITVSVGAIEYAGSKKAVDIFTINAPEHRDPSGDNDHRFGRTLREIGGIAYSLWAGAMSAVEVNNTLGLESTKKRRLVQSASYGVAVSLWSSTLPGFKQAQEVAIDAGEFALDNPVEALGYGAAGSVAIYGVLRGAQAVKNRLRARKAKMQLAENEIE